MLVLWYPVLCTYVGGAFKSYKERAFLKNKIKQVSFIRNPQKLKIGFLHMISQQFISTPIKTSTCLFRAINALLQVVIKVD